MLENEIMLNVLYFDIHEIIVIKRNIYYKIEYVGNVKTLNLIESLIKKIGWNHNNYLLTHYFLILFSL